MAIRAAPRRVEPAATFAGRAMKAREARPGGTLWLRISWCLCILSSPAVRRSGVAVQAPFPNQPQIDAVDGASVTGGLMSVPTYGNTRPSVLTGGSLSRADRLVPRFFMAVILLLFMVAPAANAQCSFVSVSGSGFYNWVGTNAYVLPAGGTGTLSFNFTGAGCTWELYFENGDTNGITLPGDGSLNLSGTSSGTSVSLAISVASDAASGFTTASRGATWQMEVNGAIVGIFNIYQNSSGCAASLSPSSASVAASGGSGSFSLNVPYCWYDYNLSPSGENWFNTSISTTSGVIQLNGSGPTFFYGTINYTATANATTSARSASFSVVQPNAVSFTVNQAAGTSPSVTLIADPPSLTVTSPVNGPDITQTINFTSSSSSTPVDITNVTDDATPWDFGSWSPGPTPSSMPITFYPAGLNIGTYTDTFVVTSSASNSPLNIPVTFNIVESSVTLIADPPSLTVTSPVNGPDITQTINFTSSSSSTPVDITNVTDDATPWDFGSWSPGPTPSSMPIIFYPAGLNIGTYTDTFVVTSSASNSPLNIPITFNIVASSSSGPPGLGVSPSTPITNCCVPVGSQVNLTPTPISLTSSNSTQIGFSVTTQTNNQIGGNWLLVSLGAGSASSLTGTTPASLTAVANMQGFVPGTYAATISIKPLTASSSGTQTIQVSVTVTGSDSLIISFAPMLTSSTMPLTITPPSTKGIITVQSSNGNLPLSFNATATVTTPPGGNWLQINASSPETNATVSVTAETAGLANGNYEGEIDVYDSNGVAETIINVTLTVSGSAPNGFTVNLGYQFALSFSGTPPAGAGFTITPHIPGFTIAPFGSQDLPFQTWNGTLTANFFGNPYSGMNFVGSMSHVASGGGQWTTTFTLLNDGATTANVTLNLFDDNGNPLPLPLTFPQGSPNQTTATFTGVLDAGAGLVIETAGLNDPLVEGWAQLLSDGDVSGFAVFTDNVTAQQQQQAVVPLQSLNLPAYLLWFDNTNGFSTGVALANESTQPATMTLVIRDDSGMEITTQTIQLPAQGHKAFVLATYFPMTANLRGTVEFDEPANGQISVLGLSFNPASAFTSIPAITP
jgi:hypothetical protein